MNDFDFLSALDRYGVDAVLVAFVVAFGVWILKKTLLKNHRRSPFVAFLPFILGIVLFAGWQCVLHRSFSVLSQNAQYVAQRGFAVGCISTVENAILSRLCGKKPLSDKASLVRELLCGVAEGTDLDELSVRIASCVSEEYSEEDVSRVTEALKETAGEAYAESELRALAGLIVQTLKTTAA